MRVKLALVVVGLCFGLIIGINIVDAKYRGQITSYIERVNWLQGELQKSDYRPVTIVPDEEDRILGWVIIQKGKDEAENLFFPYPKKLNFSAMGMALDILGTTNDAELKAIKQKYNIK